ncbi:DsbA family protein [Pectobacterium actinidiae]|uniref:DsbA family protein n=1 Tax=Pectobacterium actinidiae TaxID=1507808 RepID=UPI00382FAFA5
MQSKIPCARSPLRRLAWPAAVAALTLLALLIWRLSGPPSSVPLQQTNDVSPVQPFPPGPPWYQGPADARFTLVLYADLECPYCKVYYPELTAWIAGQRDIRLQWHHMAAASHDPAASHLASIAECAGKAGGHSAYWKMITWLYQHTRGDGEGLSPDATPPGLNEALQACLDSEWPGTVIRSQFEQARRDGVQGTPSLRLIDRHTERSMVLTGPVQRDALLSALDMLAATQAPTKVPELSAGAAGDKPR